jgi:hypothetical protein
MCDAVVRVTMEHENGQVKELTGSEARRWVERLNQYATHCVAHGWRDMADFADSWVDKKVGGNSDGQK